MYQRGSGWVPSVFRKDRIIMIAKAYLEAEEVRKLERAATNLRCPAPISCTTCYVVAIVKIASGAGG